jgi:hypothetical protein
MVLRCSFDWIVLQIYCAIRRSGCRIWHTIQSFQWTAVTAVTAHRTRFLCNYARRSREVKAGIPCSSGAGRRGFDPRQLRRTKRAFFPPLAI